jgi:hypothetical protein
MCTPQHLTLFSITGTLFLLFTYTLFKTQAFYIRGVNSSNVDKLTSNALGGMIMFALLSIVCGLKWWCSVVKSSGVGVVRRGVERRWWRNICCFWRTATAAGAGRMSRPNNNNNNSTQYELIDSSSEGGASAYSSRGL